MNARIDKLEKDVAALKIELASLHEHGAKAADVEVLKVKIERLAGQFEALSAYINANFVSKVEFAELKAEFALLRAEFNNAQFGAVLPTLASKDDVRELGARFDSVLPTLASKDDVKELGERFDSVLPTLASKEDLANQGKRFDLIASNFVTKAGFERGMGEMGKWMLRCTLALLVSLGGLQYGFYTSILDNLGSRMSAIEVRMANLQNRVDASQRREK